MCFTTCFLSFSFTLLISFNTTKIVHNLNVCKHFTNYFALYSYVIKHSLSTCHVHESMNTNKQTMNIDSICYHINNTSTHAICLLTS